MSLHYLVKYEYQKKWRQSEIRIVINDKSQGSVAKHLSWDDLLYFKFIIQFAGERTFLNQRTFGEITRNMVDRAMCPIRQFWKSVNIWGNDGKSLVYCFSTHGVLATISQSVMLVWFVSTRQNRRVPLHCTVARCDIVPGRLWVFIATAAAIYSLGHGCAP